MKNVIFCYSGTGNCLDMAKNIAAGIGGADIIMMRKYPAVTDVRDAEKVGFVFPCYGGGLPGNVAEYIKDIKVSNSAYTFGVAQCAAYMGEGLSILNKIIPLDYWAAVSHQCSCIWLFPHDVQLPKMDAVKAQARSERLANKIAGDINNRTISKPVPARKINSLEHALWPKIAQKKARAMSAANDRCINCGMCAEICPTGNITYIGKTVTFGNKCIQCMGCVQYCPTMAINVGKITEKRERYHNKNVSAEELTKDIISV